MYTRVWCLRVHTHVLHIYSFETRAFREAEARLAGSQQALAIHSVGVTVCMWPCLPFYMGAGIWMGWVLCMQQVLLPTELPSFQLPSLASYYTLLEGWFLSKELSYTFTCLFFSRFSYNFAILWNLEINLKTATLSSYQRCHHFLGHHSFTIVLRHSHRVCWCWRGVE